MKNKPKISKGKIFTMSNRDELNILQAHIGQIKSEIATLLVEKALFEELSGKIKRKLDDHNRNLNERLENYRIELIDLQSEIDHDTFANRD